MGIDPWPPLTVAAARRKRNVNGEKEERGDEEGVGTDVRRAGSWKR